MAYHRFTADDGSAYGSFEVFFMDRKDCTYRNSADQDLSYTPGWYWQACFPGCLPDSDPVGPFASEEEAIANARED